MEQQSYYSSLSVKESNIENHTAYLVANCTGIAAIEPYFMSNNDIGRNDYYLQYLLEGEMEIRIDGKKQIMRKGDIITYFPHTSYQYAMHGDKAVNYYWIHFTGNGSEDLMKNCKIENKKIAHLGVNKQVILSFDRLFDTYIVHDSFFELSTCEIIVAIYLEIAKTLAVESGDCPEIDKRLNRVIRYIHKNYNTPIEIGALAAKEYLSTGRFRVLFKARTGLSPYEYLLSLRLNHARQLMLQSNLSIKEIADAVGYSDQMYFCRIFKSRFGLTPSSYRKNNTMKHIQKEGEI